jgi:hypothetical protein
MLIGGDAMLFTATEKYSIPSRIYKIGSAWSNDEPNDSILRLLEGQSDMFIE